ncbi:MULTISPECIES: hypothetical protein [Anaerotruncus]|uniref:hypothetical protein n=2 Tax=Anaerotruncus TaxID=244127 RepID=UPI0011AF675B|nr:hypothetical protein [Anaerotruncus massiliensis (ex Togo et al. 2019)]
MDRIELIRRLNGVLLDEMPAYRGQAAGFPDDLRSAVYHEKIPAARDFACKENSGQNTSAKKTDWANAQSAFLYLLRLSQSGLSSHSEAVSPEKALPEPAAWGLAGERIKTASLGELHAGQDASQYLVRYVTNRKPSHRLLHRAGSRARSRYFFICRPIFGHGFTSYQPQAGSKARTAGRARPCRQPLHVGR